MTSRKRIYKILFQNQGNLYELYARKVAQSEMYAFVEIEDIIFGERSAVLVDPSEERLKAEFAGVIRTHIPLPAVVRIDEVEKEGQAKIIAAKGEGSKVTHFPVTPPGKPGPG